MLPKTQMHNYVCLQDDVDVKIDVDHERTTHISPMAETKELNHMMTANSLNQCSGTSYSNSMLVNTSNTHHES